MYLIKLEMAEDKKKYHSPKIVIELIESVIKTRKKLKNPLLTKEERRALIDQYSSLLNETERELIKPTLDPKILNKEESKYIREPLLSYFDELTREMKKPLNLRPKKSRKIKKNHKLKTSELPPGISEEIVMWFHICSKDSFKHIIQLIYLSNLEIENKEEKNERDTRCELEFFSSYLISRYISLRFELMETSEEEKQKLIQQALLKKEKQVDHYELAKIFLDQIIDISLKLNKETLTEEERANYNQKRESYRRDFKLNFAILIKSGLSMEEDLDDLKTKKEYLLEFIAKYKRHLIQKRDLELLREKRNSSDRVEKL